jgi:hypothetical protein
MRSTTTIHLGTLGDRSGINVAKVEVTWYDEDSDTVFCGYYFVHATGDEPEIAEAGEYGSIYTVFENRVHEAMQAKQDAGKFDSYEIEDISAA